MGLNGFVEEMEDIVLWITNKDEHMQRASLASLINGGIWWYLEEGNVNRRRSWRWRFWHSAWLMQMPLGAASGSLKDPDVPWLSTCWILDMFFLSSISLLKRMAWSLFGKIRLCDTVGANNGEDQWIRTYKLVSPTSYKLSIYLSTYLSIYLSIYL